MWGRIAVIGLLVFTGMTTTAADCSYRSRADVALQELINNPTHYEGKRVRTRGYSEYVGDRSYFLAMPYIDPSTQSLTTSFSEVKLTTHKLHTNLDPASEFFIITEQTGGLFAPIPLVLANRNVYDKEIQVDGKVIRDREGLYQIDVRRAEEFK